MERPAPAEYMRIYPLLGPLLLGAAAAAALAANEAALGWAAPAAAWGLALGLDALTGRIRGRSALASDGRAAVWLATLSLFGSALYEVVNQDWLALWAWVGFPSNSMPRYVALGLTQAARLPIAAASAFLLAGGSALERPARLYPAVFAGGVVFAVLEIALESVGAGRRLALFEPHWISFPAEALLISGVETAALWLLAAQAARLLGLPFPGAVESPEHSSIKLT